MRINEIVISLDFALDAIIVLKKGKVPILGSDILSIKDYGSLSYAYHLWGNEYHYLDWYCNKENDEAKSEYVKRSSQVAVDAIQLATQTAKKLGRKCLIVLVVGEF